MPDSTRVSLTDQALATSAAHTLVASAGPGAVPTCSANLTFDGTVHTVTGRHQVNRDWDQLASDPPIMSAAITHPNRKFYAGMVDSSNQSIISSFDGDASAYTPINVNSSYNNFIAQVQCQDSLYVATAASSTKTSDLLHHAQQGTGNDVNSYAFTIHNYTDGSGQIIDMVGSGAGMLIRHAHNSTARPDKPSNYIATGPYLQLWQLNGDLTTWTTVFQFDTNSCGIWYSDWTDRLSTDAPIQVCSKTHPNRRFSFGYIDAYNASQWQSIDMDAGAYTPIIVAASYMQFQCGIAPPLATKTGAYTLLSSDNTILANATTAAFSVTLPAAQNVPPGWTCHIKKIDSSANAVTIATQLTDKIDGQSSVGLSAQYASKTLVSDGSANWNVF